MTISRRTFLASVAAAALVRPSPPAAEAAPIAAPVAPVTSTTRMWQDLARTIPAVKAGDPVAVMDDFMSMNGRPIRMIQPNVSARPTLGFSDGRPYVAFDGVDDVLIADNDDPLFKAVPSLATFRGYPAGKVFEIHTSTDTSRAALLRNEDQMMRKWGIQT